MAQAREPPDVKLICGMISADRALLDAAAERLAGNFGPAEIVSDDMPFDFTHYYDAQMGSPLFRRFVAFAGTVKPDRLAEAKLATNRMERDFSAGAEAGPLRPINLDPGYVSQSKLVLASMKNFAHRIYLSRGVWAEVTLTYHKGAWRPLPWTFPDYASGRYDDFLRAARDRLRQAGRKESCE